MNFDDILQRGGGSPLLRQPLVRLLPKLLLTEVFGAVWVGPFFRLLLAGGMLLSLWHLGRRWRWSPQVELVVGVIALTLPIFARAFLTDYTEFLVVSLGQSWLHSVWSLAALLAPTWRSACSPR